MTDFILPPYITQKFNRGEFPGKSNIEDFQHTMMIDGQMLERSIHDAQMWIKDGIKDLEDKAKAWINDALNGASDMLPLAPRIGVAIGKVIQFIKDMMDFIKDVIKLVQAVIGIIKYLQGFIASIVAMVQSILNAIASLEGP